MTLWRGWDYTTRTWQERSYTLMNETDGYMVVLDEKTRTRLNTAYDADARTLTLIDTATQQPWLWLTVGGDTPPAEGLERLSLFPADGGSGGHYAWHDPSVISAEKVRYMVTRLYGEGGGPQ